MAVSQPRSTAPPSPPLGAPQILELMLSRLAEGSDQPELWPLIPALVSTVPELHDTAAALLPAQMEPWVIVGLRIIMAMCTAAVSGPEAGLLEIEPLSVANSQSALVQGAVFYLESLLDADNPKYQLKGKLCPIPFEQMDVLEGGCHLCCASWLKPSVGDISTTPWREVWNSGLARQIRASVHDGSYRYCNKMACPKIQGDLLPSAEEVALQSGGWRDIVEHQTTEIPGGPGVVNLAYDRTCNLSCPSCRTEKFAADAETRERYAALQEVAILPMLKHAHTVFITGSGDPFASKNFRHLMERLGPDEYPELRFQIMSNGMLFTRREWERFPALHGRVRFLRISIDAATAATHERLRRGARWPVMLENLAFAGELRRQGLVDAFHLAFCVQKDNYREMGDAVDLAGRLGTDQIFFGRITNWGTFTDEAFRDLAVFLPTHPEHAEFLSVMTDPRLRMPVAELGAFRDFLTLHGA